MYLKNEIGYTKEEIELFLRQKLKLNYYFFEKWIILKNLPIIYFFDPNAALIYEVLNARNSNAFRFQPLPYSHIIWLQKGMPLNFFLCLLVTRWI